jgi:hypothetical protein
MTDEDTSFLEGERGVGESWLQRQKASREGSAFEKGRLKLLRQATQYAQKIGIPAEAFYGWARILDPNLTPDDLARRAKVSCARLFSTRSQKRSSRRRCTIASTRSFLR